LNGYCIHPTEAKKNQAIINWLSLLIPTKFCNIDAISFLFYFFITRWFFSKKLLVIYAGICCMEKLPSFVNNYKIMWERITYRLLRLLDGDIR